MFWQIFHQFIEFVYLLKTSSYNNGLSEKTGHAFVHQRMRFDKIQSQIRQRSTVIVTLARSRIRHFLAQHRQPIRVQSGLLLEIALERVGDVLEAEGTNGAA